ncbi:condensation domain-containing protein [Microvirga roseola]|uniref:condensation domain-containing protein n=1 Tax=Microvirga roseola TaxID=2883126 RepID=UPI001E5B597F|nr:condensation domain-containing protein [Microvirga roseola]
MYDYSSYHPRHFCVVAELAVSRTENDYRIALQAVQARHPSLSALIARDSRNVPHFVSASHHIEPSILPRDQGPDWREIIERELVQDFLEGEPLARATVLYTPDEATIILTFHHAIADGIAGVFIIEDIMRALAGRDLGKLQVPASLDDRAMALRQEPSTIVDRGSSNLEHIGEQILIESAGKPLWRSFATDRVITNTIALDTRFLDRARQLSRSHGTTIHGAICTALAVAASQVEGSSEYTILNPINSRSALGFQDRGCVMLASAATHSIPETTLATFWQRARQYTNDVAASRSRENLLAGVRMLQDRLPPDGDQRLACGLMGAFPYDAVVSNLGKLEIQDRIDDVDLRGFWGPSGQARLRRERFIGVATTNNVIRLVEAAPAFQPPLLQSLKAVLVEACSL